MDAEYKSMVLVNLDAQLNWRLEFDIQDVYHWYISSGLNGAYVLKVKHKESDKEYEVFQNSEIVDKAFDCIFGQPISISTSSKKGDPDSRPIGVGLRLHTAKIDK
jgi:hypothetical protein